MLQSILVSAIVKAVLQWLKSLVDSWIEKQQAVEKGRQEVLDKLKEKEKEQDLALKELGSTNPTDADFANELRDGYNRSKANMPSNRLPSTFHDPSNVRS